MWPASHVTARALSPPNKASGAGIAQVVRTQKVPEIWIIASHQLALEVIGT
jgi:hypothetical protein